MPAETVLRTYAQYSVAVCSPSEAASDGMSGSFVGLTVPNKFVKFRDPRLNLSGEIRPKALHFRPFSNFDKCRLEVAGDVISGVAVDWISVDVCTKFGDSVSNRSRYILRHLLCDGRRTNERRRRPTDPVVIGSLRFA